MTQRRRFRWVFLALGLVAVALVAWVIFHKKPAKPAPPPAIPVNAVKAVSQDVPLTISALGAAQAWTSDTIFAQVSGKLLTVNFTEGAPVKAGQVLAEVDPAPYRAALTQAEGALKRDEALLANAKLDLVRYQTLAAQDSIARQTADAQIAQVKQDEGTVLVDQGAVAAAKVNLGWCRIVSPIAGRAGVRMVDPGNLVSASGSVGNTLGTASATSTSAAATSGASAGTGIVIINQIEPIAVTFTVPQGDFQRLSDVSDGFRKPLSTEAMSQETGALVGTGELRIADNHVDPSTGAVELKARFSNAGDKLWPGQFVNVQLTLQTLRNVTTVPVAAVNQGPKGAFVYIVGANNTVTARPVVVAWTQGSIDVIKSGVQPGDLVVVDGQMILKAGSRVRVAPTTAAKPQSP